MAFDMAWGMRGTADHVTDPSYQAPCLGEAYPHTYTNADGKSINAGWAASPFAANRSSGPTGITDPRLLGINYRAASDTFSVDLSSGSAPGAGNYTTDWAIGETENAQSFNSAILKDDATALITLGAAATSAGHFVDATGTDRAPGAGTTAWNGVAVSVTFASTMANFIVENGASFWVLAHFRLTLQGGATTVVPPRMLMLLGVGA